MSWTLFRAVLRLYLLLFAGVLAAVLVVFLVGDFADRINAYLNNPARDVAELYWNKLLVAVHQLAPAAMLLAAGAAVSTVRKRGEWTAMQALGFSRAALMAPIAACTLAAAAALVVFDEWVVTGAGTRVDKLMVERFQRWGDFRFYYFPKQWFRVGAWIFYVRGASTATELTDVTMLRFDEHFHLEERLDVDAASWLGGSRWRLTGAEVRRFGADGTSTREAPAALEREVPGTSEDTFRIQTGRPELMPLADLSEQLEIRAKVGLPIERFELAWHNRFAYPVTGVAATMLAVALALRRNRKGHLTVALVEGLVVTVALFSLMLVGKALVLGEHLPAAAAAWAPVVGLLLATAAMQVRWPARR